MASRGKKKTTMAKLNRETRLRERRQIKEARKDARKDARGEPGTPPELDVSDPDAVPLDPTPTGA